MTFIYLSSVSDVHCVRLQATTLLYYLAHPHPAALASLYIDHASSTGVSLGLGLVVSVAGIRRDAVVFPGAVPKVEEVGQDGVREAEAAEEVQTPGEEFTNRCLDSILNRSSNKLRNNFPAVRPRSKQRNRC
jgi:hypothetical protein